MSEGVGGCHENVAGWVLCGAVGAFSSIARRPAGSAAIDAQLRSLTAGVGPRQVPHVHAFGHSHWLKDFELRGVRYVQHPVCKAVGVGTVTSTLGLGVNRGFSKLAY